MKREDYKQGMIITSPTGKATTIILSDASIYQPKVNSNLRLTGDYCSSYEGFAQDQIDPRSIYNGLEVVLKCSGSTMTIRDVSLIITGNKVEWRYKQVPEGDFYTETNDAFWRSYKLPEPVAEMTMADVCKALGKTIKIVKD